MGGIISGIIKHNETNKKIFRVVLTGGPCAGKTSSLSIISDHFRNLGWHVYTSVEAASMLVGGGVSWAALNETQWFNFQKNVIKTMMQMEDTYMEIAQQNEDGKPSLILCDRGVMDCSAYVDKETFSRLLAAVGINSIFDVKDDRYDLIVHLISTSVGAEEFYSLENNAARTESLEEARQVDSNILKAWTGHPTIVCIDNRTQFKEKVVRALQAICKRVEAPPVGNSTVKRKFLVSELFMDKLEHLHYEDAECEYTYLQDGEDYQQRLRKRGSNNLFTYTHIVRSKGESGHFERYTESCRNISAREYESLYAMALPDRISVTITKRSFVFETQYFSLAIFQNGRPGLMLLEIYEEPNVELQLPTEFMKIDSEVTKDPSYSMFACSKQ